MIKKTFSVTNGAKAPFKTRLTSSSVGPGTLTIFIPFYSSKKSLSVLMIYVQHIKSYLSRNGVDVALENTS